MFTSFSLPDDPAWEETRQQAGDCQGEGRHVKVLVWRILDTILQKYQQRVLFWRLLDFFSSKIPSESSCLEAFRFYSSKKTSESSFLQAFRFYSSKIPEIRDGGVIAPYTTYTVYTVDTVFTLLTHLTLFTMFIQTALLCLNTSMYC